MSDERKARVGPWIIVGIILPMLYVASFGPACWMASRFEVAEGFVSASYLPIAWAWLHSPESVKGAIQSYVQLRSAKLVIPSQSDSGVPTLHFIYWW